MSAVFSFVDDPGGLAILNVTIAGASALLGVHPGAVAATAATPGSKAHKP